MFRFVKPITIFFALTSCILLFFRNAQAQSPTDRVIINNIWPEPNEQEGKVNVFAYVSAIGQSVHISFNDDQVIVNQGSDAINKRDISVSPAIDPMSLVIAVDNSSAMDSRNEESGITARDTSKEAINSLIRSLPLGDQIGVYKFLEGAETTRVQPLTDSPNLAINVITELDQEFTSSNRPTCVYHAIFEALDAFPNVESRRRALVVLTSTADLDGQGQCNIFSRDDVIQKAQRLSVPLFMVGFGSNIDVGPLNSLAELTGGYSLVASDPEDLSTNFTFLSNLIKSQQLITYETDAPAGNYFVSIQVKTDNFDGRDNNEVSLPYVAPPPTSTPRPTATNTPTTRPTATNTPTTRPTETNTPTTRPTATNTPIPTETNTPTLIPTETLVPEATVAPTTDRSVPNATPPSDNPIRFNVNNQFWVPIVLAISLMAALGLWRLSENPRVVTRLSYRMMNPFNRQEEDIDLTVDDPDRTIDPVQENTSSPPLASLKIITETDKIYYENARQTKGQEIAIDTNKFMIGRNAGGEVNTLHIDDNSVSRRHAEISFDGKDYFIKDLESRLGTKARGTELSDPASMVLQDDTPIEICGYMFQFQLTKINIHGITVAPEDVHRVHEYDDTDISSHDSAVHAWLLVKSGGDVFSPDVSILINNHLTIGRNQNSTKRTLNIPIDTVALIHGEIRLVNGEYVIEAIDNNQIKINGIEISDIRSLRNGMIIEIGGLQFEFMSS